MSVNGLSYVYDQVDNPLATVIFAHGAGAGMKSSYIEFMTKALTEKNIAVIRFNFPYMVKREEDGKRRPPDRMPKLIEHFQLVLNEFAHLQPLFLVGKSMGSRVAATIACDEELPINGVISIGYPFHPQKKPEKLRLEPLQLIQKPILILQGDRDALGNKEEIKTYNISSRCQVNFFQDGDHDLKPRVKSGFTHQHHLKSALKDIEKFIHEYK